MCDSSQEDHNPGTKKLAVAEAVGTVLAHDITEIRPGEFKGRAFKKGHIIRKEDVCHLQRLGKENLFVLNISQDELHEAELGHGRLCMKCDKCLYPVCPFGKGHREKIYRFSASLNTTL